MNNPLLYPLARRGWALWNKGHQTHSLVVTYVAYLWFPWQCEYPPAPIINTATTHAYHYHIIHHLNLSPSRRINGCSTVACLIPVMSKYFRSQLISAALECLHKLNMFINTFFFFLEKLPRYGRIIHQELCCVLLCKSLHSFLDALFRQQQCQVFLIKIGLFACVFAYIKSARWTIFSLMYSPSKAR